MRVESRILFFPIRGKHVIKYVLTYLTSRTLILQIVYKLRVLTAPVHLVISRHSGTYTFIFKSLI